MLIINSSDEFKTFIYELQSHSIIALDTEFVRRDTYYAKLALIQIATKDEIFIIDPLSVDLKPFTKILANKNILKIIHAPRQDVEIFYHYLKTFSYNIFDTQEAAKYCNIRHQISYRDLCSRVLNIEISKEQQFRNWLIRPLDAAMLEYAAQDVRYLIALYDKLRLEMLAYHSLDKFRESMMIYEDKNYYVPKLEDMWSKVKLPNKSEQMKEKIRMLAAFREAASMTLDLPRQKVITDAQLLNLMNKLPTDHTKLNNILPKHKLNADQVEELLDLCTGLAEELR